MRTNAGFLYGILQDKPFAECGRPGNFVAPRYMIQMGLQFQA
ncbi:MAG: hypothetical protein NWE98_04970 [Candidatus Bathyarchaeota archaeon]|nr:hypothetical protein [Candidatus Bathyarchaeota archaeon]